MAIIINESDIGKTEIQLLMDLIYESAGIRVPQQKIVYGKPQEMDFRPDVADDPNTFIPVVIDQDYDDRFTPTSNNGLLYRRRDIATHFILPSYDITEAVRDADLVIGSVLIPGNRVLRACRRPGKHLAGGLPRCLSRSAEGGGAWERPAGYGIPV